MRGIHIAVRDYQTNKVINDQYGPAGGPFQDSRKEAGKIIWFRPRDYMHPQYVEDEEFEPGYEVKRDFEFDIKYYGNKHEWYFCKNKKADFLPKCMRDHFPAKVL